MKPTQAWRTFAKRPIRQDEDGWAWLIQVGDDPEDYLVAAYDHNGRLFLNGVTIWHREDVIRFAKINMD